MLYRVSKMKFDGFYNYYPYESELVLAESEDEAKTIYKQYHTCRGRQKIQVDEVKKKGVIAIDDWHHIYIGDELYYIRGKEL